MNPYEVGYTIRNRCRNESLNIFLNDSAIWESETLFIAYLEE